MAINSLYPGFVRHEYLVNAIRHIQIFPVIPAFDAGVWKLTDKTGALVAFTTSVDAYVTLWRAIYPAAATTVSWQIWSMATVTSDPVFQVEYGVNLAGLGGAAVSLDSQIVTTYRTFVGGLYRHYLMEPPITVINAKFKGPNFINAAHLALINYLIGNSGWVRGRDGATLVVATSQITKYNDALRRRRILQS